VVAFFLALGSCVWPGSSGFAASPETFLFAEFGWAIAMTLGLAAAIASFRRGPAKGRAAAFLALAISLLCICGIMVQLGRVLRR
jgi:hypothetical protein